MPSSSINPGLSLNGTFITPWRTVSLIEQSPPHVVYYTPSSPSATCIPFSTPSEISLQRHELTLPDISISTIDDWPSNISLQSLSVFLLVNPVCGTGSSSLVKKNVTSVTDILKEAGINVKVRYTEHAAHAQQILAEYGAEGLHRFAAVASVGGDGTLHEVLNGILQVYVPDREGDNVDWGKIPALAVVPCGSGNGIAVSLGIVSVQHAALNIVHGLREGRISNMEVLRYVRGDGEGGKYLAGGVQWGLPADVDLGTEWMRFVGDTRFDVGTVVHILSGKSVEGKIRVVVDVEKDQRISEVIAGMQDREMGERRRKEGWRGEVVGEGEYVIEGDFVMCVAWNSEFIGEGFKVTPMADVTELGVFDFLVVRKGISVAQMFKVLLNCEDGSYVGKTDQFAYFKAKKVEFERIDGQYLTVDGESVPVEPFVLETAQLSGHLRILNSFAPSSSNF